MSFCPSCGTEVDSNASGCKRCRASFDGPGSWKPVDTAPTIDRTPVSMTSFILKFVGAVVIMCIGATYGLAAYKWFSGYFTIPDQGSSGLMLVSFLAGIPFVIGVLVGYLARRRSVTNVAGAGILSGLSACLFIFAAGAFLGEGMVCIAMATPFLVALAVVGGVIGALVKAIGGSRGHKLLSVAVVIPFLLAPFESEIDSIPGQHAINRSIYIHATPDVVWRHINFPLDIRPQELQQGIAFRIGVPYPLEARTLEGRVGGLRELQWQRGIRFQEEITAREPNRYIAWKHRFGPESFPPDSLDDHIVIGGRYFGLDSTSYTLAPENGGTRLKIAVVVSVNTNFNWYAGLWAKYLTGDTTDAILGFYKVRSEAAVLH